jgi:hypothetical protein
MDDELFEQLCRDTCVALNQSDIDALTIKHQIKVDGVNIGLFFDALHTSDRIVCYVEIGDLPDLDREENLRRLWARPDERKNHFCSALPLSGTPNRTNSL